MKRSMLLVLLLSLTSLPVAAQTTIGALYDLGDTVLNLSSPPLTLVDLAAPAAAAGSVTSATVWWGQAAAPCAGSFRIKFFRPVLADTSVGTNYNVIATRGPFNSQSGVLTVPISPAVAIEKGDVIGVVQLRDTPSCGSPHWTMGGRGRQLALITGEFDTFDLKKANIQTGAALNVRAGSSSTVLEGIIAAVGSAAGANGSFFKTSLQLTNNSFVPLNGYVVFHPAGVPASESDPRLTFSIPRFGAVYYDDVVRAMGRSGLGSLDIYTEASIPPTVWARVYDDRGVQGTMGFVEDFMRPTEALPLFASSTMTVPDPLIARSNFGVRTLAAGARVHYSLFDRDGKNLKQVLREYGPNTFTQVPIASLFDLPSVPAGRFTLRIQSGSAILYLSTTDNQTNDSAIEFAQVH